VKARRDVFDGYVEVLEEIEGIHFMPEGTDVESR